MDTAPILLGNLLKEIPPTHHITAQDESRALSCHEGKLLTLVLIRLLAVDRSALGPRRATVSVARASALAVVAWWPCSLLVSSFTAELQTFPLSLAIKSGFIQFPRSHCLLSKGSFHDNFCLGWYWLQHSFSSLLGGPELFSPQHPWVLSVLISCLTLTPAAPSSGYILMSLILILSGLSENKTPITENWVRSRVSCLVEVVTTNFLSWKTKD